MQLIKQSEAIAARRTVILYCVNGTGLIPYTGGAGGTTKILYPGAGTFTNSGTLTAATTGTGHYYVALPTADIATLGPSRLTFAYVSGTVLEAYADLQIVPFDPYDSTLGMTYIGTVGTVLTYTGTIGTLQTYLGTVGTVGTLITYLGTVGTVGTVLVYTGTVGTVGSLKVNLDKSAYSLAADQSAVTIGTVNTVPAIGSVGTVGTLGAQAQADVWNYGTRALTDKAGFSLAADQSTVTIGTLNVYGGTVGTVGTLKVNVDKTAYSLAADQSAVTIGTVNTVPAIGSVGTVGTLGAQAQADVWGYATRAITDKAGFSLAADQSAVTIGTLNTYTGTVGTVLRVGSLLAQARADVNAEVVDVIGTDTIAELGVGAPSATPALKNAVMAMYMDWRNAGTQGTIGAVTLRRITNDAGTIIAQSTLADDGTLFTKTEYVSG